MQKLYQNFYMTLKKFVCDESFVIEYEEFGEQFELAFDKEVEHFYFKVGTIKYPKIQESYRIIKSYILRELSKRQEDIFNGSFENSVFEKYDIVILDEKDKKIFFNLIKEFEPFLLEEPIEYDDIKLSDEKVEYAFSDVNFSKDFVSYIIDVMIEHPDTFEKGIISSWMWDETFAKIMSDVFIESLKELEDAGYLVIDKEKSMFGLYDVALSKKFYNALKLLVYYDYDASNCMALSGCVKHNF